MELTFDYSRSKEVLKTVIEKKIGQLISSSIPLPPGVVVVKPTANWIGDTIFFSCTIQTAVILKKKIKGSAKLEDGKLIIRANIPKFIIEEFSEEVVIEKISTYLQNEVLKKII